MGNGESQAESGVCVRQLEKTAPGTREEKEEIAVGRI